MTKELKTFDKPENVKRLLWAFYAALAALIVVEFFIAKHGQFGWDESPAFYAVYGFLSYVVLIFTAKGLRRIVKRDEDYYE